jgi:hypothetical protein
MHDYKNSDKAQFAKEFDGRKKGVSTLYLIKEINRG